MIIDLKNNVFFRGFAFEVFTEKYLRKKNGNAFIFKTNRFANLDRIIDYYKLNLNELSDVDLIRDYFKSIDILEFRLRDYKSKIVESIIIYEVKTKIYSRNRPVDISRKTNNRYRELIKKGFIVKLVFIKLLSDWKFNIKIFDYEDFKDIAIRKKRFLFSYEQDRKVV